ncbi:MAG: DNA internalization-related competence protein ComEC/Rec2 [Nakamurella sp.]
MTSSTADKRPWVEDHPPPPVDLRLVPAALAIWAGVLVALLVPRLSWWVAATSLLAALVIAALRFRWWWGCLVIPGCMLAAITVVTLQLGQQANDPLTFAAERGSWAALSVTVAGFPQAVDPGFLAPDNGATAAATQDQSRWRVLVTVQHAVVAGQSWEPSLGLTIYGEGRGWSPLVPGQLLEASGRLGQQATGPIQQIILRARDPPVPVGAAPWWNSAAQLIREKLSANAAELSGDAAGLLPGLVVGDTSGINDQLDAAAKTTGVTHLLAVSGSHFAILCGIVVVVLRRFGPRCAALGGFATLVGLVILVGPQPSVLRAALMGGIGMLALLTGRNRSCVPALAAAVIALLFVDPTLAISAGFTLSVLATAGLILIAPAWSEALQRRRIPRGWADVLAVPVAAQIVTMPVIVLISGTVSVVGVLANLLVAPVVAPALVLGVLCAVTGPWWSGAAGVMAQLAEPLLSWIAVVAHSLARWPDATVPWPATPAGALLLAGLTVAVMMLLRHHRFRALFAAALAGVVAILVPARVIAPGWPADNWLLIACEVGQGDALVLSTGENATAVVVDTGPDPGLMDACLDRLGIGTIPLLVLTHLHADHIAGLAGAIEGRSVGAIAVGPGRDPVGAWAGVFRQATDRHIPVLEFRPGLRWESGELGLTVLGPKKEFRGTDSDPNNDSLVLMAERDSVRILLSGDIEIEAQQALLNAHLDLTADVLKLPHHGSAKLLDSFVTAVSPRVAVIGVGVDNDYGHPSGRALDLLRLDGVDTILRTDQQGDVSVGVVDGELSTAERGATTVAR